MRQGSGTDHQFDTDDFHIAFEAGGEVVHLQQSNPLMTILCIGLKSCRAAITAAVVSHLSGVVATRRAHYRADIGGAFGIMQSIMTVGSVVIALFLLLYCLCIAIVELVARKGRDYRSNGVGVPVMNSLQGRVKMKQ